MLDNWSSRSDEETVVISDHASVFHYSWADRIVYHPWYRGLWLQKCALQVNKNYLIGVNWILSVWYNLLKWSKKVDFYEKFWKYCWYRIVFDFAALICIGLFVMMIYWKWLYLMFRKQRNGYIEFKLTNNEKTILNLHIIILEEEFPLKAEHMKIYQLRRFS